MARQRKVVVNISSAEITEKRSRFIAVCFPASSQKEAEELIGAQRKKYYDARHTCYAYVCGENDEIKRSGDDGEPQGTAGNPILDVICANNLKNALITVTRYFGGTLLGTGGLVRAYSLAASNAVEEGIRSGSILSSERGAEVAVTISYKDMGRFEHYCRSGNVQIDNKEFGEKVQYMLSVREEALDAFEKDVKNMTQGNAFVSPGPVKDLIFS